MNDLVKAALVAAVVYFGTSHFQKQQAVPVNPSVPSGPEAAAVKAVLSTDTTGVADDYLAGLFETLALKGKSITTGKQVSDLMSAIGETGTNVFMVDASPLVELFAWVKPTALTPEDKQKVIDTMLAIAAAAEAVDG
jgi:hypothetical protein